MRKYDKKPEIHLTFDDGPDEIWTSRILDALERANARATFFPITPLAQQHPDLVGEMQRAGHQVEFHCVEHVRHTELTRGEIETEAKVGLQHLASLGVRPRLWRTPWGRISHYTAEVADAFGLRIVPWTADTHDWRGDAATEMLESVKPLLLPGAIVLMHDGLGPGALRIGCEQTVALIEPMVAHIRELGCEPTRMETLKDEEAVCP